MKKKEIQKIKRMLLLGFLALLGARMVFYGISIYGAVAENAFLYYGIMPGEFRNMFLLNVFLALIPVIIWTQFVYLKRLKTLRTKKQKRRELMLLILIFVLGTFTVPLLSVYYNFLNTDLRYEYFTNLKLYDFSIFQSMIDPMLQWNLDYYGKLEIFIHNLDWGFLTYERAAALYETVSIVIDAWLEEIVKLSLLLILLRTMKLVKTIGDAIAFSVLAGLGFAFIENIIYFMNVYLDPSKNNTMLMKVVIFRTIVLSIGHMTFSGIFGYFYGLSKFGLPLYEEKKWDALVPCPVDPLDVFLFLYWPDWDYCSTVDIVGYVGESGVDRYESTYDAFVSCDCVYEGAVLAYCQ